MTALGSTPDIQDKKKPVSLRGAWSGRDQTEHDSDRTPLAGQACLPGSQGALTCPDEETTTGTCHFLCFINPGSVSGTSTVLIVPEQEHGESRRGVGSALILLELCLVTILPCPGWTPMAMPHWLSLQKSCTCVKGRGLSLA